MWENDLKALDHWTLQWFMHWITVIRNLRFAAV